MKTCPKHFLTVVTLPYKSSGAQRIVSDRLVSILEVAADGEICLGAKKTVSKVGESASKQASSHGRRQLSDRRTASGELPSRRFPRSVYKDGQKGGREVAWYCIQAYTGWRIKITPLRQIATIDL